MAFPFFLAEPLSEQCPRVQPPRGSTVGAKAASGHRGHDALARKVAEKIVNKATDEVVNSVLSKADAAMSNESKKR